MNDYEENLKSIQTELLEIRDLLLSEGLLDRQKGFYNFGALMNWIYEEINSFEQGEE